MPEHTSFDPYAPCPEVCTASAEQARMRQAQLTKPPGSLGQLEDIAIWLAGAQATEAISAQRVAITLFAADHGITAQGVSLYPSAVTAQMLQNFAGGRAAISVLAKGLGARLEIVDVGVATDQQIDGVVSDKQGHGTRDFSVEAAMTSAELSYALGAGARAVDRMATFNPDIAAFGEMGIGNTTTAAALLAALTGHSAGDVTGAGTGLDQSGIAHKAGVIECAIARHDLHGPQVTVERALLSVGGYEIAAMTGGMIAAAQRRIPVLVDGFIATVAALVGTRMTPSLRPFLAFGHRSAERGHDVALDALHAKPILDLGMRLGEGSGAAVAVAVLRHACDLHTQMATFAEAGVSGPE